MNTENKIKNKNTLIALLSILCIILSVSEVRSENLKQVISLEGTWRFSIGDNPEWKEVNFTPKNWDYVSLPQSWENSGYIGYDGFAWYRKTFKFRSDVSRSDLLLVLGYIDDVDEVYFNGKLLGNSGIFPPVVKTSYTQLRKYHLPIELINLEGENVIAIRVYDEYQTGGVYNGPLGIYYNSDKEFLLEDLSGYWDVHSNYKPEDEVAGYPSSIYIPGHLESRGYYGFDGHVSFSKDFEYDVTLDYDNLILVLGYIDANEKVYLNDKLIGTVDEIRRSSERNKAPGSILRGYELNRGDVVNGNNNITIVIENNGGRGGIIKGPIGIIKSDDFETLRRIQEKEPENYWEEFFKNFWD